MPMPDIRRPIVVVLAVFIIACGGGGSRSDTPTPTADGESPNPVRTASPTPTEAPDASFEEAECEFELPVRVETQCGWLTVPENRSDPDTRDIRLHLAIFESTAPTPADGPVVYLEGGPGDPTLEYLSQTFDLYLATMLEDRDVIVYDQRGVGFSEPALDCPEVDDAYFLDIDEVLTDEEFAERVDQATRDCRDRLRDEGVDLSAYNSVESAADLDDMRRVLGYDEWNLYGLSYGTKLALTVLRDHPEGVRSVVMDSVYPLEADLYGEGPENELRALQRLFEKCRTDLYCRRDFPDLEALFISHLRKLDEEPIMVGVADPYTLELYPPTVVDGATLFATIRSAMYDETWYPFLPALIVESSRGYYDLLSEALGSYFAGASVTTTGVYWSVQCREEVPFASEDRLATVVSDNPDYAPYLDTGIQQLALTCATWGAEEAPASENLPVESDVPTLILSGEMDPVTPPRWAYDVEASLEKARAIVFPGLGHGVTILNECAQDIRDRFLNDPAGRFDTSCTLFASDVFFVPPLEE